LSLAYHRATIAFLAVFILAVTVAVVITIPIGST